MSLFSHPVFRPGMFLARFFEGRGAVDVYSFSSDFDGNVVPVFEKTYFVDRVIFDTGEYFACMEELLAREDTVFLGEYLGVYFAVFDSVGDLTMFAEYV